MPSQTKRAAWGTGRQIVLAHLDDIRADLERGSPLKSIYRRLDVAVSYVTFTRAVGLLLGARQGVLPIGPGPRGADLPAPHVRRSIQRQIPTQATAAPNGRESIQATTPLLAARGGPVAVNLGREDIRPSAALHPDPVIDQAMKRDRYL